jgi:CheY-like chemotaxis protein
MPAILVLADDDADLRAVYAPCLRTFGYTVHEAADGHEALALVHSQAPALLILDLWMPVLNGFEVLDRLRFDPLAGRLKVLVLSNAGDADTRLEAFGSGAVSYLVKGVSLADFLAEVDRALGLGAVVIDPV